MSPQQITESVPPIIWRLGYIAIGIVAVAVVSFLLALFVGNSRPARRAVFLASSLIGFAAVFYFAFTRS